MNNDQCQYKHKHSELVIDDLIFRWYQGLEQSYHWFITKCWNSKPFPDSERNDHHYWQPYYFESKTKDINAAINIVNTSQIKFPVFESIRKLCWLQNQISRKLHYISQRFSAYIFSQLLANRNSVKSFLKVTQELYFHYSVAKFSFQIVPQMTHMSSLLLSRFCACLMALKQWNRGRQMAWNQNKSPATTLKVN